MSALGGEIEWNNPVLGMLQDDAGVSVELGTGEHARAVWAIGCDGAHSQVRKGAGIGFSGSSLTERFLLADVHTELPGSRQNAGTHLGTNGQFVAMPLPHPDGDLWRLMAPVSAEQDGELGSADIVALLRRFAGLGTAVTVIDLDTAE